MHQLSKRSATKTYGRLVLCYASSGQNAQVRELNHRFQVFVVAEVARLHHDTLIDTIQLYLVFNVVAQLYKHPRDRQYPKGFFNNLWRHLVSLDSSFNVGPRKRLKGANAEALIQLTLPPTPEYQIKQRTTEENSSSQSENLAIDLMLPISTEDSSFTGTNSLQNLKKRSAPSPERLTKRHATRASMKGV